MQYDIRDASQEIRDSYKMYYKLKTSFLEDTLNDVLSDDGFDVLEMSQCAGGGGDLDISLTESINGGPQIPLDISKLVETPDEHLEAENCNGFSNLQEITETRCLTNFVNKIENHVLKEFEAVEVLPLNDKAWGAKVTMKPEIIEKKNLPPKSLKNNFNQKLFQNSSFSKRNPRKSLSRSVLDQSARSNTSQINDNLNSTNKEVLPDLETILLQKAKEQQAAAIIAANPLLAVEKTTESIKTHIDEGWLERNAAQNGIKTNVSKAQTIRQTQENHQTTPNRKSTYGLSNMDVSKFQHTPVNETATQLEPATVATPTAELNLENIVTAKAASPIKDLTLQKSKKSVKKSKDSDSDSVVDDSEGETESQEYRHIVKRRRLMPSLSPKTLTNTNSLEKTNENQVAKVPDNEDDDLQKDFSADSENDKDYVEENPKAKRKKAVAKRKTVAKLKSSPKEKKPKAAPKEKKPAKTKTTRAAAKKKSNETEDLPEEELQEQPLNPEDLRYSLALERGDLTSVPRIKQSDLDKADNLAQEYINTIAPLPGYNQASSRPIPLTAAQEKRATARGKLEDKIASGKLNENFVTINIQKKTFVRGKKSVNFSKYKKKQWKHKKHIAALTGPDMDMRGCDGGTLKCFTCGQAGHFAQNCKIKGDTLLPLTAQLADDPSPFPTLEEAERMASQKAVAVHSKNISKLPQAANVAIYQTEKQLDSDDEVRILMKFNNC